MDNAKRKYLIWDRCKWIYVSDQPFLDRTPSNLALTFQIGYGMLQFFLAPGVDVVQVSFLATYNYILLILIFLIMPRKQLRGCIPNLSTAIAIYVAHALLVLYGHCINPFSLT